MCVCVCYCIIQECVLSLIIKKVYRIAMLVSGPTLGCQLSSLMHSEASSFSLVPLRGHFLYSCSHGNSRLWSHKIAHIESKFSDAKSVPAEGLLHKIPRFLGKEKRADSNSSQTINTRTDWMTETLRTLCKSVCICGSVIDRWMAG